MRFWMRFYGMLNEISETCFYKHYTKLLSDAVLQSRGVFKLRFAQFWVPVCRLNGLTSHKPLRD